MTETIKLLDQNAELRQLTGVQKFHDAGYFGERVCAATGEAIDDTAYNPDGMITKITSNFGVSAGHGVQTASAFFQVAPKTKLYSFSNGARFAGSKPLENGKYYDSLLMDELFPNIDKLNITAMFTSLTADGNVQFRNDYAEEVRKYPNFCPCWSAGNDGEGQYNKMMELSEVFGIGAFTLNGTVGSRTMAYQSRAGSSTEDALVDFCGPWSVFCLYQNTIAYHSGTSFAAPWICGMICLVNDFFIDKTGKPLTREKMYQFLSDYSVDLSDPGMDKKAGWGAPVLPDPSEIDISKYADIASDKPEDEEKEDVDMDEYILHTVVEGETLESIALDYFGNAQQFSVLLAYNNLESVAIIPGQEIKIPKKYIVGDTDVLDQFSDANEIADWAKPYVRFCVENGILNGSNGKMNPNKPASRQEIATMISRTVDYILDAKE